MHLKQPINYVILMEYSYNMCIKKYIGRWYKYLYQMPLLLFRDIPLRGMIFAVMWIRVSESLILVWLDTVEFGLLIYRYLSVVTVGDLLFNWTIKCRLWNLRSEVYQTIPTSHNNNNVWIIYIAPFSFST